MNSLLWEIRCELLKLIRTPVFLFSVLLSPLLFYCFFGLAMGRHGQIGTVTGARYLLATYGTFGVLGVSLFGFGANLAVERGLGWLQVKRASPMRPLNYLVAKLAVAILFSMVQIGSLFTLGALFGDVRMPPMQWLTLGATLVAGAVPFCCLGLAIGYALSAQSAPGVVNMMYLGMAFCSGLWVPMMFLPLAMQKIAVVLPAYHLAQLALSAAGAPFKGEAVSHLASLAAFMIIFTGLAYLGYTRQADR